MNTGEYNDGMTTVDKAPSSEHAASETAPHVSTGTMLALASATAFGLITVLARLSYDGGVSPATVNMSRLGFGAVGAGILVLILRKSLAVPRALIPRLAGLTVMMTAVALFYFYAVAFIPVSLFVLIFYTYPFMVAGYTAHVLGTPLGGARWAALVIAFAGLAIALTPSFQGLDWRGIALTIGAAVLAAAILVSSSAVLRHMDYMAMTFYATAFGLPLMALALPLFGGLHLPTANVGWIGLLGAGACYVIAVLTMFSAVRFAGPARAALFFNIEPVATFAAAAVLLGERLSMVQYAGAALVIGALGLASWADRAPRNG